MFPMNQQAEDLLMGAPSEATREAAPRALDPRREAGVGPTSFRRFRPSVKFSRSGNVSGSAAAAAISSSESGAGGATSAKSVWPPAMKLCSGGAMRFARSIGMTAEMMKGSAARICSR